MHVPVGKSRISREKHSSTPYDSDGDLNLHLSRQECISNASKWLDGISPQSLCQPSKDN